MSGPLTDEQMAALEAAEAQKSAPQPLSDEQMAALEAQHATAGPKDATFVPGRGWVHHGGLESVLEGIRNPFGLGDKIEAGLKSMAGPSTYRQELASARGERDVIKKEHPILNAVGEGIITLPAFTAVGAGLGAQAGAGALLGGAGAASESKNLLGEQGTNLNALKDVGAGAAGGAAGAALGYGLTKGAGIVLGKAADRAARMAAGGTTKTGLQEIQAIQQRLGMEPGELANTLRQSDVVGGFRGLHGVEKGAEAAAGKLGKEFGALTEAADKTGVGVPMTSVRANLQTALDELAPKGIGASPAAETLANQAHAALEGLQNPVTGQVGHGELQDVLAAMAKRASKIQKRLANPNALPGEGDEAYLAVYQALRKTQDESLTAALGGGAKELRQGIALNKILERTAGNRALQLEGSHPIGLLGMTELASAGPALMSGHTGVAAGLAAHALLGKATAPLRANLLTTALSGSSNAAKALGNTLLPLALGQKLGSAAGGALLPDEVVPAPPPENMSPEVARRILAQALQGK